MEEEAEEDGSVSSYVEAIDAAAFARSAEELRRLGLQRPSRRLVCDADAAAHQQGSPVVGLAPVWWPAQGSAQRHSRGEEHEEEAVSIAGEAPVVPAGYRHLPEAERQGTLGQLQLKLDELEARYASLPLRIETEGHRRQQKALRQKIQEIEKAVHLISRPGGVLVEI